MVSNDFDDAKARAEADHERLRHLIARVEELTDWLVATEKRLAWAERRTRLAEGNLRYEKYRTRYVSWQLESSFNRRWWRLGEALWMVWRRPSQFYRLPIAVLRATRKRPRPVPPRPPRRSAGKTKSAETQPKAAVAETDAAAQVPGPEIPELALPQGPVTRPDLTVAVILDNFSAQCLAYEWNQIQPGPDDWPSLLTRQRPDLLFVESAWSGNDKRWFRKLINEPSEELRELVAWCRKQNIPTVFWNKEDPPNFDLFIETAKLFDHVFTTCSDMLSRYHQILGHTRVEVLPFAAQPRIHNPVNVPGGRRYDVAFAGTYFTQKHPERAAQMKIVVEPAREWGLHIFSRTDGENRRYRFPDEYAGHVVGTLPYDQMLAAYKSYKVFLNVNSVLGSPTMCARRIFELSACRTPVLSGYARAIGEFFPGLVQMARTPEETRAFLAAMLANSEMRERQAHLAMREVFEKHTFSHRLDQVLRATGRSVTPRVPKVSVIMSTNRPDRLPHAIRQVARQRWSQLQFVLVLHGLDEDPKVARDKVIAEGIEDVVVVRADKALPLGSCLNLAIDAADGDLIAKMDDDDIYGEHYLSDLVPAFSYTTAGIVGKWAAYVYLEATNATLLSKPKREHVYNDLVRGGTLVCNGELLRELRFDDVPRGSDTKLLRRAAHAGVDIYSADRFNYVYVRGASPASHTHQISDEELLEQSRLEFYGPPEEHACI